MKKVSLKQFTKSINLKELINHIDAQIMFCRTNLYLSPNLIESIVWESSNFYEHNEIIKSDIKKMFKRRCSDFTLPIDFFDITSVHTNFSFIKEIELENKIGKYFINNFYSKINKYYYISIEEIPKHKIEPGDNFLFKSKVKLKSQKTMDLIKKNLLKYNKSIDEIKIRDLCFK